ncbi:MAG: hypothetical protein R3E12_00465 [Candidatus Eisenbacteria bacterium]
MTGLGGIGKTRLALEAAGRLLGSFRGGTFFLPLADAQTAEDLLRQIASAIGVDADELDLERLGAAVPTDSLLILDNFEQMEDRAALLLPKLLEACPSVNLLVTSRRCLGFAGEVVSAVEALATEGDPVSGAGPGGTDPDGSDPDGPAASSPAARLFRDRVERVRPDIEWTRSSVQLSATITRRLEGIPLAIELAAARCGILTVRQLSERLTKRLDLLKVTRPDIPERHAALRGAFDWSFRLLPRDVQKFLVDLSVFRGSWTVDAAEDVCDAPLALDWMELLCDCSLLIRAEAADEIRFRFFDVVREYLTERMTPTRLERLLGRKLRYLARVVDRDRQAIHGGSRARLVAWFQAELDNVRHVLTWSEHRLTSSSRDLPTLRVRVLGMCGQLGNFWRFAALHAEGAEWNRRLLEAAAGAPSDPSRTAARWTRGYLLLVAGREAEAARMLEEVLEDQRRTRNLAGQADSLLMLGHIHLRGGDSTAARTCLEEALAIFRRLEQGHGIGAALSVSPMFWPGRAKRGRRASGWRKLSRNARRTASRGRSPPATTRWGCSISRPERRPRRARASNGRWCCVATWVMSLRSEPRSTISPRPRSGPGGSTPVSGMPARVWRFIFVSLPSPP